MDKEIIQENVINYKNNPTRYNLNIAVSSFYETLLEKVHTKFSIQKVNGYYIEKKKALDLASELIHDQYEVLLNNYNPSLKTSFLTYAENFLDYRIKDVMNKIYENEKLHVELDEKNSSQKDEQLELYHKKGNMELFQFSESFEDNLQESNFNARFEKIEKILKRRMTQNQFTVFIMIKLGNKKKDIAKLLNLSNSEISRLYKNSMINFNAYFDESTKTKIEELILENL